jgi:threonine/homoserine efflux transporter RhtA
VLSRVDVSDICRHLSIDDIVAAFAGWLFFHKSITAIRWIGIVAMCMEHGG